MNTHKRTQQSFEYTLIRRFAVILIIVALLCSAIIHYADLDSLEALTLLLVALVPCVYACWRAYNSAMDMLKRTGLQFEALSNEEYNTWHLAGYESGLIDALKRDNERLALKMKNTRNTILQQETVLLEVIEQLAIPVVVLDSHGRVYSANQGFHALVVQPINSLTGRYAKELALTKRDEQWVFETDSPLSTGFRLYNNHIFRGTLKLDIVMCFSVTQTLRENEKQVWQKLLRVLNHEVRNSLTPISSIAQSLQHMLSSGNTDNRSVELLQVIEKRAQHLLGFVEAYSAFNRIHKSNKQPLNPQVLSTSLTALNSRVQVDIRDSGPIFADEGHLQQCLINLVKNASEADAENNAIVVIIDSKDNEHVIRVLDQGPGIQNKENLFVPFYSTKQEGNGIGLVLSRELMRQQGGELTLQSRTDAQGAEARLTLPRMPR